ncbi:Y-family DNA polymerase [Marinimicrobium alkaliphilum]|uniref:Y-family DNA polymerase n=1 Tax=Marinimicrobium alkaliphilum TaxID=2202654 RepID=UPI000DB9DB6D|nr:DNA polymerase Y family protein [Marinimicrobium alkaliphilum]
MQWLYLYFPALTALAEAEADAALRDRARLLYRTSADISLHPPAGLWLKLKAMRRLYPDLRVYWAALAEQLETLRDEQGYHYAPGATPLAARLLALTGYNHWPASAEPLNEALAACPLVYTDLSDKVQTQCRRLGLTGVGELSAMPLKALARRFDSQSVHYIGRLTGQLKHPLAFYQPEDQFAETLDLYYEVSLSDRLMAPIDTLLAKLESFLRRRDSAVQQLTLQLWLRDQPPERLQVGAAEGLYRVDDWHTLLALSLTEKPLAAPVYALGLYADRLCPQQGSSQDLLAGRRNRQSAAQLVNVLQARLGRAAVQQCSCANEHRPEYVSSTRPALTPEATAPLPDTRALRPTLLLPKPQALAQAPDIIHGPERITTGWWDGALVVRDYYVARRRDSREPGQWCWVYRIPNSAERHRWYLHGYFS